MENPKFNAVQEEQGDSDKIKKLNLPILPQKVKFSDIDWEDFFQKALTMGYNTPDDFSAKLDLNDFNEDGRVNNMPKLLAAYKEAGWRDPGEFLDKNLKPKIKELIKYMGEMGANISLLRLSLSGEYNLKSEDQVNLQNAVVNFCIREFETSNVSRAFEIIEGIFPLVLDSFQILEKNLPKILQKKYIDKTPAHVSDTKENFQAHFARQGFKDDELEELTEQMSKYSQWVWIWRELLRQKSFKLKKKDKSGRDQYVAIGDKKEKVLE